MTSLRVSEIFDSLQGEGPNVGTPCSFLRLAGCNLTCSWCDSKYTWDFETYSYDDEVRELTIAEVASQLSHTRHLVITGGEPMLQHKRLPALLKRLDDSGSGPFVEVETNGTLAPTQSLAVRIDQWNVSPKLANAGDPLARRIVHPSLVALKRTARAFLKLVVEGPEDLDQVHPLVETLRWPRDHVCLMLQATDASTLIQGRQWLVEACISHGYRYSPRLHVELWGDRRGV